MFRTPIIASPLNPLINCTFQCGLLLDLPEKKTSPLPDYTFSVFDIFISQLSISITMYFLLD